MGLLESATLWVEMFAYVWIYLDPWKRDPH